MDIQPNVNLLRSLRGERVSYNALIGEGVDNAFDAGATRVEVLVGDDEIIFRDDGVGITRDKITSVFTLGDHGAMSTTQLGRFGVGIKSQAVNAGNVFRVVSRSRDGYVIAEVDWRELERGSRWEIDDPVWTPVIGGPTGTEITIAELRKSITYRLDKLSDDLAKRFHPAIAGGKTILLNGVAIRPLSEPKMTDIVEHQIGLSEGRSAHLRAGILVDASKLNRVHVTFRHRVIMPASTLGCGEYGGLTQMFARLELSGPWDLAKFKDDLTNEDQRQELEEAVLSALKPILEKCSTSNRWAKINRMTQLLNEMIPPEIAPARPNRKSPPKSGGKSRRGKSGMVEPEKSQPEGPAKSRRTPRDNLLITLDGSADEDGIGAFQSGRPHRVNLSHDNLFVAELVNHRDEAFSARCLLVVALAIYEEGRQSLNPELPFQSFGLRIAKQVPIQQDDAESA